MTANEWIGKPVSFRMARTVDIYSVGVVIDAKPKERAQPGDIPDLWLTIRGESGKQVTVSLVDHYVFLKNP